jgi:hypothetical protein
VWLRYIIKYLLSGQDEVFQWLLAGKGTWETRELDFGIIENGLFGAFKSYGLGSPTAGRESPEALC